jgi:hypothetical protein
MTIIVNIKLLFTMDLQRAMHEVEVACQHPFGCHQRGCAALSHADLAAATTQCVVYRISTTELLTMLW